MANIMIVDDDADLAILIQRALRRRNHQLVAARSGDEALSLLDSQPPDLIVLDVLMPGSDGVRVCQSIRRHPVHASVPVLFLTVQSEVADKVEGSEAGADDYMTKPFELDELECRVEALLRRRVPRGTSSIRGSGGALVLDRATGQVWVNRKPVTLTPVEHDLLAYLIAHAGEVLSAAHLLHEVWEYPRGTGNPSLVRMHVLNIRRKIEKDPKNPTYLRTVPRHGYTVDP